MQALGTGEVEVGFVDGNHFYDGRELAKDGSYAVAPFGIFLVMAVEEDGMRAEFSGSAERHGGLDAVFAGFVAGSGDYAALIGATANDHGLPRRSGRSRSSTETKKAVHVHVEDGGVEGEVALIESVVFGTEAREIRHESRDGFGNGGGSLKFRLSGI